MYRMITIRDGRIWFYVEDVTVKTPILDFRVISGYICPHCNTVIAAYFVGIIPEELFKEYVGQEDSHQYEYGHIKEGGSYVIQANHGESDYQGQHNCIYQSVTNTCRGISNCLVNAANLGSLYNTAIVRTFAKAIERGELKERGIIAANDICGADEPILLFDMRTLLGRHLSHRYYEERLPERLKSLMEEYYEKEEPPLQLSFVDVANSIVGRRKINLAKSQTVLF